MKKLMICVLVITLLMGLTWTAHAAEIPDPERPTSLTLEMAPCRYYGSIGGGRNDLRRVRSDPLYLHLRRPHSDGIRTFVCIKNGEFAGKKTILLCERYKVLGNATLYCQVLHCIKL